MTRVMSSKKVLLVALLTISLLASEANAGVVKTIFNLEQDYDFLDWNTVNALESVPVFFATERSFSLVPIPPKFNEPRNSSGELTYGSGSVAVPMTSVSADVSELIELGAEPIQSIKLNLDTLRTIRKLEPIRRAKLMNRSTFLDAIKKSIKESSHHEIVVYIHGFNNHLSDAMNAGAEIANHFACPVVVYDWPCLKTTNAMQMGSIYIESEKVVEQSNACFSSFMNLLDQELGSPNITMLAHSMGNHLLQDYLQVRKSPTKINHAIFCSADVDGNQFVNKYLSNCRSNASHVTVFASDSDKALEQSAGKHDAKLRLGHIGQFTSKIPGSNTVVIDLSNLYLGYFDHEIAWWAVAKEHQLGTKGFLNGDWVLIPYHGFERLTPRNGVDAFIRARKFALTTKGPNDEPPAMP